MNTKVIKTFQNQLQPTDLKLAVQCLQNGGLVAFPTETVYGLAAAADIPHALKKLAHIKERPDNKPFTLHIGHSDALSRFVPHLPLLDRVFLKKAWPGPLTTVFELNDKQLNTINNHFPTDLQQALYHQNTLGIRFPDQDTARTLLSALPNPIVAPSANLAGQSPPTNAQDILQQLNGKIDLIIDDGPTKYARASTIIKLQDNNFKILRQGILDKPLLQRLRNVNFLFVCTGNTCRSPMAEAIFKFLLSKKLACSIDRLPALGYNVLSAGVMAYAASQPTPQAIQTINEYDIDISRQRAKLLTTEIINWADFIFVMTNMHYHAVIELAPNAQNKTSTIAENKDIPDPIGQPLDTYRTTAEQINKNLQLRLNNIF